MPTIAPTTTTAATIPMMRPVLFFSATGSAGVAGASVAGASVSTTGASVSGASVSTTGASVSGASV